MEQAITFFKAFFGGPQIDLDTADLKMAKREQASGGTTSTISVTTGRIVGGLAVCAAILLLANFAVLIADYMTEYNLKSVSRLTQVFSVDHELNAPAFFSTLILLFSSLLLGIISVLKYKGRESYRWHWVILSLGFLLMAFDEIASVHERTVEPLRAVLGGTNLGVFYYAWVVPGIVLVLTLGFIFLRFWWNLPVKTRVLVMVAATLYLGGALGFELLDGSYAEVYGKKNIGYVLLCTAEESLEMAGVLVFIKALLSYITDKYEVVAIDFRSDIGAIAVGRR